MSAARNIYTLDSFPRQNGGLIWHRLHSERQDVCEALIKESLPIFQTPDGASGMAPADTGRPANWHCDLLQSRLSKIDDALDRLLSGSYGSCCECGRWIEDAKLDFDPAIAFCIDCWQRRQISH